MIEGLLNILKREDIKFEIKNLFKPVINLIFEQINPYIYICIILIVLMFIMILVNLILLIQILRDRTKYFSTVMYT